MAATLFKFLGVDDLGGKLARKRAFKKWLRATKRSAAAHGYLPPGQPVSATATATAGHAPGTARLGTPNGHPGAGGPHPGQAQLAHRAASNGWTPQVRRPAAPLPPIPADNPVAGPQHTPGPAAGSEDRDPGQAWTVLATPKREPVPIRVRRWAVMLAAGVLILTGVTTITGRVLDWVRPAPAAAPAAAISDLEFAGAATVAAVDYLSWDQTDKQSRQAALARLAAPQVTIDGWDGTGRQRADTPAVIGLVRGSGNAAVVTVRVRVVPFTADPATQPATTTTPQPPVARGDIAAAPNPAAAGWSALPARWLNLAIPLAPAGGGLVVTTRPVLVGSPPRGAPDPALAAAGASGDAAFAAATRDTVTTLLRAYGSGDLAYGRASGTDYTGLDQAATLDGASGWRVAPAADAATRVGDATVTWALSGGAGKLTATYRIELKNQDDRWYLASVSAESKDVK